jgi:aryl-alcohol dehydrogenase-like predicted oxidoreductase
VPYSPLGRGLLTGALTDTARLDDDDFRRTLPRFADDALARNLELVAVVREIATALDATPGQALAWLLAQGQDVVPIPGTKRVRYLEENVGALGVTLSADDMTLLDDLLRRGRRRRPLPGLDFTSP